MKQKIFSMLLLFSNTAIFCSESDLLLKNNFSQKVLESKKEKLLHNINEIKKCKNSIEDITYLSDHSDDHNQKKDIDDLYNMWITKEEYIASIKEKNQEAEKKYGTILFEEEGNYITFCCFGSDYANSGKCSRICQDIFGFVISPTFGSMVGTTFGMLRDMQSQEQTNIGIIIGASLGGITGLGIKIWATIYKNKKFKEFKQRYPDYYKFKKALKNLNLYKIEE